VVWRDKRDVGGAGGAFAGRGNLSLGGGMEGDFLGRRKKKSVKDRKWGGVGEKCSCSWTERASQGKKEKNSLEKATSGTSSRAAEIKASEGEI